MLRGDKPATGTQWGPWTYRVVDSPLGEQHVLQYASRIDSYVYAFPLNHCTTSAMVLDWIMQLYKRPLMNEGAAGYASIGYLIEALNDLLYPQQNLCSGGHDKTMDVLAWLNRPGE